MQRPKHNSRDLMMMKLSFSPSAIMLVNPLDTTGPPPWLYCHANPAKTPHQDHSPSSKRWIFCLLIIAVFRYQESWLVDQLFPVTSFTRHFHASLVALRTNLAAVGLAILVFQRARLSHTPQALSHRRQSTPHPIEEPQSQRLRSHSCGCRDGLYTAPRCPISRQVSNTQRS